jgi:hypothetical protein
MENIKTNEMKSRVEEINQFLSNYTAFREAALKQVEKEEIVGLYSVYLSRRYAWNSNGDKKYPTFNGKSTGKWASQLATDRQKKWIKKLVERGRVKFEGGTSLETITKMEASRILDTIFGKRA